MRRLGKEKKELDVIYDQIGTPTNASDLATVCLEVLSYSKQLNTKGNIYHYSNEGVASWYDFATAIMELGKIECKVRPIETKDYPTAAKRPYFSVLNKTKIKNDFEIEIPYWRTSLARCILKLKQE
jgi:dTDP-4-dehydrorhamnose reductase